VNTKAGKVAKARLKKALGNKPVNITTQGRSYSRVVAKVRNGRKSVNKKMKGYGY
jgi:endonuclease YncB( thermonuclease family)